MRRLPLLLAALLLGGTAAGRAQTPTPSPSPTPTPGPPTTIPSGTSYATENSGRVNGVRIQVQPDGSVWFLEAGADRVGVLRGSTITYWQLRPTGHLGANPVDFEIDGDTVWLIESGESEIPAGYSSFAALDTLTGALTEWVVPGSIPAAFYRAPDGKVWIPETNGLLQSIDLATLEVVNYRSTQTFAFADMVLGPDGALWLTDFGNNRIVRWELGAATETAWTFFNPAAGRLNPAEMKFDEHGQLWIAQFSGNRMDRFDPATGALFAYSGVTHPIHFDVFQDRIYATSGQTQSAVTVLDPGIAVALTAVLTPQTNDVRSSPGVPLTIRSSTITPTTFTSSPTAIAASDLTLASAALGALTTNFPSTNTYGVAVADGYVWVGTDGKLVNLVLQTIGSPEDQIVPVASQLGGPADSKIRVDLTLSNTGASPIAGDALYLFSAGSFAARTPFTLAPGATAVLTDAFAVANIAQLADGPVRIRVSSGTASDLLSSVRSTRVAGLVTFGYAIPAATPAQSLGPGSSATLFTGFRDTEASILGIFAPAGASGTLTLLAPNGTTRGTRAFNLATDTLEEFNPAASAFGVDPEPGDAVRVAVTTGTLQAYVKVLDLGTRDVALVLPAFASRDAVAPNAGQAPGVNGVSFVSDLLLSNPDPSTAATVSVAYYALGGTGPPAVAALTLAPLETRAIADFLPTLFGAVGQGAFIVTSSVPIASSIRIAARTAQGDYGTFARTIDETAAIPANGSAVAIGLAQTVFRRTNLLLFNRGDAGVVTVTGFRSDGSTAGSLPVALTDHAAARINGVFAAMGVGDQDAGRIRIDVPAGMRVYAWTAELDALSGDLEIAAPH